MNRTALSADSLLWMIGGNRGLCWFASTVFMLLSAMGCGQIGESGLDATVANIQVRVETSEKGVVARVNRESDVRQSLAPFRLEAVLSAVETMFEAETDPRKRAQAIAALLVIDYGRARDQAAAKNSAIVLGRKAVVDKDPSTALCGVTVLRRLSEGCLEDQAAVIAGIETARERQLTQALYDALWYWGNRDAILAPVFKPYPENLRADEAERLGLLLSSAIHACERPEWRGEKIPQGLATRLVELIERDPALVVECCRCLVFLRATQAIPEMNTLFGKLQAGVTRTVLGTAIIALNPQDAAARQRLPRLMDDLIGECAANPDRERQLSGVYRRLAEAAGRQDDLSLLIESWDCCKALSTEVRARYLGYTFIEVYTRENLMVGLLGHITDDELKTMLEKSEYVRETLKHTLLRQNQVLATPRDGHRDRGAQEDRVRGLLN